MMRLVLASNNAAKLAEMRTLLDGVALECVAQAALAIPEADEPHATFVENALAKARHAAAAGGAAAVADDSGLCVAALGGAPGVHSARYAAAAGVLTVNGAGIDREAGRRMQDAANNALLLQRMQGQADRSALFVSTLVAVRHAGDPQPLVATGRWPGEIAQGPLGVSGFGYDPLMFIPAIGCTVAEMDPALKNVHSHRAQAMAQLRALLREVWQR